MNLAPISRDSLDAFKSVIDRARITLNADVESDLSRMVTGVPDLQASRTLDQRAASFIRKAEHQGAGLRSIASTAVVASLALQLCGRLSKSALPDSVLEQFPVRLARLASSVTADDLRGYGPGDESFLKDLRTVSGHFVPCGPQDVDLFGTITRLSGLKSVVTQHELRNGLRVFGVSGPTWFRIHTDSRYLDDFNESGWERCYHRIADLLSSRPWVKGMVGTAWIYDPQLLEISPRLAYLQRKPTQHGAFLVRHGPGKIHTQRALHGIPRADPRRARYDAGSYVPICYSLVWPRKELLGWSARNRSL